MKTINIKDVKENIYELLSDVNNGFNPITIINNKGRNAVLISEDEWKNVEETLYLSSIPRYAEIIKEIDDEQNWSSSQEYIKGEEW